MTTETRAVIDAQQRLVEALNSQTAALKSIIHTQETLIASLRDQVAMLQAVAPEEPAAAGVH